MEIKFLKKTSLFNKSNKPSINMVMDTFSYQPDCVIHVRVGHSSSILVTDYVWMNLVTHDLKGKKKEITYNDLEDCSSWDQFFRFESRLHLLTNPSTPKLLPSNSAYCLPYNSHHFTLESLLLDQLITPDWYFLHSHYLSASYCILF